MSEALKWSIDWRNLKPKEKFLMGAPFIATEDKVYKDIVRQLKERNHNDLEAWNSFPSNITNLANNISNSLMSEGIWPSTLFLPNDPADIPLGGYFDFTDKWDIFPAIFDVIKKDHGIQIDCDLWEKLPEITYVQAVQEIDRRKIELNASRDASHSRP